MKKNFLKIMILIAVIILIPFKTNAQCEDPCPDSTWLIDNNKFQPQNDSLLFDSLEYRFSLKQCDIPYCTMYAKLDSIKLNGANIGGMDMQYILRCAIESFLYNNPKMDNDSLWGMILDEWKFIQVCIPKCWRFNYNYTEFYPCETDLCCCVTYRLNEKNINKGYSVIVPVEVLNTYQSPEVCPGAVEGCIVMCDAFESISLDKDIYINECTNCQDSIYKGPYNLETYLDYPATNYPMAIKFALKTCPNGNKEIVILNVKIESNSSVWNYYTNQQVYNRAVRFVFSKLNLMFDDFPIDTLTLQIQRCWKRFSGTCQYLEPCPDNNPCCYVEYTNFVYDEREDFVIFLGNYFLINPYSPSCDAPPNPCSISFCGDTTAYYIPTGLILYKFGDQIESISQSMSKQNISYVRPNPTTGETDIIIQSVETGLLSIKIFDIKGDEIISKNLIKKDFEVTFHIDLSKYLNGVYNYKILTYSKEISSGKFVISR